jgi:hypothetical protein
MNIWPTVVRKIHLLSYILILLSEFNRTKVFLKTLLYQLFTEFKDDE